MCHTHVIVTFVVAKTCSETCAGVKSRKWSLSKTVRRSSEAMWWDVASDCARSSTAVSPASPPRAKTCLGSNGNEGGATGVAGVRSSEGDFPRPAS
jgi:hypothetical protein